MREKIEVAISTALTHFGVVEDEPIQPVLADIADAVLDAMREPTEAMAKASALKHVCSCGRRITQWGANSLPAMIDAAKEER